MLSLTFERCQKERDRLLLSAHVYLEDDSIHKISEIGRARDISSFRSDISFHFAAFSNVDKREFLRHGWAEPRLRSAWVGSAKQRSGNRSRHTDFFPRRSPASRSPRSRPFLYSSRLGCGEQCAGDRFNIFVDGYCTYFKEHLKIFSQQGSGALAPALAVAESFTCVSVHRNRRISSSRRSFNLIWIGRRWRSAQSFQCNASAEKKRPNISFQSGQMTIWYLLTFLEHLALFSESDGFNPADGLDRTLYLVHSFTFYSRSVVIALVKSNDYRIINALHTLIAA